MVDYLNISALYATALSAHYNTELREGHLSILYLQLLVWSGLVTQLLRHSQREFELFFRNCS